jgi:hypothetical protein
MMKAQADNDARGYLPANSERARNLRAETGVRVVAQQAGPVGPSGGPVDFPAAI